MPADIRLIPCLSDNYAVLIHDPVTEATAVVDVPEPGPVMTALEKEGWTLTHILVTHHHADHTQGITAVKAVGRDLREPSFHQGLAGRDDLYDGGMAV